MPNEVEIAWLAGLLEGEGCFTVQKFSRRGGGSRDGLRVMVQTKDRDVIDRAAQIGETTTPPRMRPPQKPHWSPQWYCLWSGAHAERVMRFDPALHGRAAHRRHQGVSRHAEPVSSRLQRAAGDRMTIRTRVALTAIAIALALPTTANAAITTTYCNKSLRGQTSLAPDNDIKAYWNLLESQGYDVVSAGWYGYYRRGPYDLELDYQFYLASGYVKFRTFRCWRVGGKASGAYRDGRTS